MTAESSPGPGGGSWTIERAEALLSTLAGVRSARVVARPGGEIQEIHILTDEEVQPKQTVRNVESALLAHFDLEIDHRKVSVAQTRGPVLPRQPGLVAEPGEGMDARSAETAEDRIIFLGNEVDGDGPHRITARVQLEWRGERYEGSATGTDVARGRLEATARAALDAVSRCVEAARQEDEAAAEALTLALDGVKVVEAFERRYALVAVHAITGRGVTALSGAAGVADSAERAVTLATLQATGRWVRGRIQTS